MTSIPSSEKSTDDADALFSMSLAELSRSIQRRDISVERVAETILARVQTLNPMLHAFITIDAEGMWRSARQADAALARGDKVGLLHGVPLSVKDHFATRGLRTTAASKLYADCVPDFDATIVERMRDAGALLIGKANMYELGTGWGTSGHFPVALNPWNPAYSPGGSSSGSAVAVATGLGVASLASDGGGSTRVPANYCGVVGLKPTHGRVSFFGSIPESLIAQGQMIAKTISTVGIITRKVEDAAIVLRVIAGWDSRDPGTEDMGVPDFAVALAGEAHDLVIGVPWAYIERGVTEENAAAFAAALNVLRDAGAKVVAVGSPSSLDRLGWMWTTIAYVEMSVLYGDRFTSSPDEFGPELQDRIRTGLATSARSYFLAMQARIQLRAEWLQLLKSCDAIATPSAPAAPPTMDELVLRRSDLQNIGELARYTRPYNMTGLPAVTVPDGLSAAGLPLGLQIGGRPFDEATVLRVAEAFERRTPWHRNRPVANALESGSG